MDADGRRFRNVEDACPRISRIYTNATNSDALIIRADSWDSWAPSSSLIRVHPRASAVSSLLEVVFDQRSLLPQELHVRVRLLEEVGQPLGRRLKALRELSLLLVAPGLLNRAHLRVQP